MLALHPKPGMVTNGGTPADNPGTAAVLLQLSPGIFGEFNLQVWLRPGVVRLGYVWDFGGNSPCDPHVF